MREGVILSSFIWRKVSHSLKNKNEDPFREQKGRCPLFLRWNKTSFCFLKANNLRRGKGDFFLLPRGKEPRFSYFGNDRFFFTVSVKHLANLFIERGKRNMQCLNWNLMIWWLNIRLNFRIQWPQNPLFRHLDFWSRIDFACLKKINLSSRA